MQVPFAVRRAPLREDSQSHECDQPCENVPGIIVGYYSTGEGLGNVEDHAELSTNNCKCVGNRAARLSSSLPSVPRRCPPQRPSMGLSTLPYDLLLNIALFLDLRDIHALHLVRYPR